MTFDDVIYRLVRIRFFFYRFFIGRFIIYTLRTLPLGIPALVCYILYRYDKVPLWSVWVALGAWAAIVLLIMLFVRIMFRFGRSAGDTPERENRNPYSVKNEDIAKK